MTVQPNDHISQAVELYPWRISIISGAIQHGVPTIEQSVTSIDSSLETLSLMLLFD